MHSPYARGKATHEAEVAPLPPPSNVFYLPKGEIASAYRTLESPYAGRRTRRSAAQKYGLAYQSRMVRWLEAQVQGAEVLPNLWYCYHEHNGVRRYCQPDVLVVYLASSTTLVVEIKARWTPDAWWQLRKLYLPVLQAAHPSRLFVPLCVCRSYDPTLSVPEAVNLCESLLEVRPQSFNVLLLQ